MITFVLLSFILSSKHSSLSKGIGVNCPLNALVFLEIALGIRISCDAFMNGLGAFLARFGNNGPTESIGTYCVSENSDCSTKADDTLSPNLYRLLRFIH